MEVSVLFFLKVLYNKNMQQKSVFAKKIMQNNKKYYNI